jgi:sugar lactone lactonase YvrE
MKSYEVLANEYQGQRLNSPNDVTLGPDGAIYFTDPTLDLPQNIASAGFEMRWEPFEWGRAKTT